MTWWFFPDSHFFFIPDKLKLIRFELRQSILSTREFSSQFRMQNREFSFFSFLSISLVCCLPPYGSAQLGDLFLIMPTQAQVDIGSLISKWGEMRQQRKEKIRRMEDKWIENCFIDFNFFLPCLYLFFFSWISFVGSFPARSFPFIFLWNFHSLNVDLESRRSVSSPPCSRTRLWVFLDWANRHSRIFEVH